MMERTVGRTRNYDYGCTVLDGQNGTAASVGFLRSLVSLLSSDVVERYVCRVEMYHAVPLWQNGRKEVSTARSTVWPGKMM